MYELMVEDDFCAAHALRGYRGPCENTHGHTWKVQVFLKDDKLNEIGIVLDFREIKAKLKKITAAFDHQNLNELKEFQTLNPSCENMARIIFEKLRPDIPQLFKTTVWESDATCSSWTADSML